MEPRQSFAQHPDQLPRFTGRMGLLFLLTGIFLANFVARILPAPLLIVIEEDLHIGHASAGSLFLVISSGVCIGLLGSGFMAARLTHRKTVILSAMLLGVALLTTSTSSSLASMLVSLTLVGISAGLYFPSGIATITAHIRPADWGRALAVHELAPNLGFVAAPLIVELLLSHLSWRQVMGSWGVFTLGIGILFLTFGKAGNFPGVPPRLTVFRDIASKGSFWIITLAFGLSIGASLGIYAVTPLYLVTVRGMEQASANGLVALSRVPGMAMALVAGWLVDRIGVKRSIRIFLMVTGLATLALGWVPQSWIRPAVFAQAIACVCFFPAGFAALARIFPDSKRSLAIALSVPMAILLGAGIIPTTLGFLAEKGLFPEGFALVGGCLMAGSLFIYLAKGSMESEE